MNQVCPPASSYDIKEHLHRFGAWTAARAAQRGLTTKATENAITASGLRDFAQVNARTWTGTAADFDMLFKKWTAFVAKRLKVTYGIAAKIVSVYLKTTVIARWPASKLAAAAHPPVDGKLLRNLRACPDYKAFKSRWKGPWSKWSESDYWAVIESFREAGADKPAFWRIERFWA